MSTSLPNLPPLSDPAYARCLAVWGTAASYKSWLAAAIRTEVIRSETAEVLDAQAAERDAIAADVATIVPG